MRKALLACLSTVALAAAMLGIGSGVSNAEGGLADAAVTLDSLPAQVSPAGTQAIYRVKTSNVGSLTLFSVRTTVTITKGTLVSVPAGWTQSGNSASRTEGSLAPGGDTTAVKADFQVKTVSDGAAGTATVTTLAEPFDFDQEDNSDDAVTTIGCTGGGVCAFLPPGGNLNITTSIQTSTYSLPLNGNTGLIVQLVDEIPAQGTTATDPDTGTTYVIGAGLGILVTEDANHQANDVDNSPLIDFSAKKGMPCNGAGNPNKCSNPLFWRDPATNLITKVAKCPAPGKALATSPCIDLLPDGSLNIYKLKSVVHWVVRKLGNDGLLPPIGLP